MRRDICALWLAASVLLFGSAAFAIPVAHLQLQSEAGDWIGQGGTYDIVYNSSFDNVSPSIRRRLPNGQPAELLWFLDSPAPGNQFALLFFGTDQLGIAIQPGSYSDAERADFASPGHPGLDISFQNRGSNTLTGAFTITEVTFSADLQTILSFVGSFEQHSEGAAPALFGQFEYRATGIPEPGTGLLLCVGLALFGGGRRHRHG
jgi:large repetitive protein